MSPAGRPTQTTPAAWAEAALDEIEAAGVRTLAVQSVARRLRVSKGGFYHHFADRAELLKAALDLWEQRFVVELGARFAAIDDPRRRLHELLVHAWIELEPTVIVQLMAAADDPNVADALTRAAASRLDLLRRIFIELGLTRSVAGHRAVLAYSSYLGLAQLRRQVPEEFSSSAGRRGYLAEIEAALLTGAAV